MMAKSAVFVLICALASVSTAFAQPVSQLTNPPRSFDGTIDDVRRMSDECSTIPNSETNMGHKRACVIGCGQLIRLANEDPQRPITGRLPSICLNAYDSVLSGGAPISTPPPQPPQVLKGEMAEISGFGYAARQSGRPPPFLFEQNGVSYINVAIQEPSSDLKTICGSHVIALRIDAFSNENYDPIMKGRRRITLSGVVCEHTIDGGSGAVIRKRCKAKSIELL